MVISDVYYLKKTILYLLKYIYKKNIQNQIRFEKTKS